MSTVGLEFSVQLGKMLDAERNRGVPKPYLGNRAVQWDRIDISDLPTVRLSRDELQRFRLAEGDILVCEGGEVGRAAIWNAPMDECYYQKALHRLRPLNGFDPRLMVAILRQWSARGVLANYVTQTSIAHLPRDKFVQVPIPKPPAAEQRAISEVLRDVDALLDGLTRLLGKKWDLKQAAMQQLLTGSARLPGFAGAWSTIRLGETGLFLKGAGIRKDEARSGDLPCVRYGEIYTDHDTCVRRFRSWITAAVARTATRLYPGDLLFAGSGETKAEIGKCVAFIHDGEAYAGGDIVILRAHTLDPLFMGYYLNTPAVSVQKASMGQGDAVVHISAGALASLEITIPEREEQMAIAAVLSDMDAEIDALNARLEKTRALKQAMMQELLTGRTRLV